MFYPSRLPLAFLLCALVSLCSTARAQLVISEIMYRPGTTFPEVTSREYVEIHNPTAIAYDISGWAMTSGVNYTFPSGTSIGAGGYIVVCADTTEMENTYVLEGAYGPWTGTLSNNTEKVTLSKPNLITPGTWDTVDAVTYASEGDWAQRYRETTFNGWDWRMFGGATGKSMELRNAAVSNDNGQNWLPSTASIGGTPGAPNSVITTNLPPIIKAVDHTPAVPTTTQPITFKCELNDETAATGLTASLFWRNATTTSPPAFTEVPMTGDGSGKFSASIPAQTTNLTIIEFYISASDGTNTRTWPAPTVDGASTGQFTNCQLQVNNEALTTTDNYYFLVLTATENAAYATTAPSDNSNNKIDRQFNTTLISLRGGENTIRYRSAIRFRGNSSRTYTFKPLRFSMPNDDPWDGITDFAMNPKASHLQFFTNRMALAAGLRAPDCAPIELRRNGVESTTSTGSTPDFGKWARVEEFNGDYVDNHYPELGGGNLYKKGRPDQYWQSTSAAPALPTGLLDGWSKQNNSSANDWSDLMNFFSVIQTAAAPHFPGSPAGDVANVSAATTGNGTWNSTPYTAPEMAQIATVADLDQWAKFFAFMTIVQTMETNISNGEDDDYGIYLAPTVGGPAKVHLVPHDFDTVFNLGDNQPGITGRNLYDATETGSVFRPLLPLLGTSAVAGNADFRAKYFTEIRKMAGTVFHADTALDPNPPFHRLIDQMLTGWVPTATITSMKTFTQQRVAYLLDLIPDNVVGGTTETPIFPTTGTSDPTVTSAHGDLIISEVLADNVAAYNNGGTFPDIIELHNTSATTTINLAGMGLSDDLALKYKYAFPNGTTLAPGARLILIADNNLATPGTHTTFSLDNGGDQVYLHASAANGGALIDSVAFGSQIADLSISRTGAALDTWALSTPTIGTANTAVATVDGPGAIRINEWLGNKDFRFKDDFIELYNPGANPVALGGMRITDDAINYPTKHTLPALSFIGAGGWIEFKAKGGSATPGKATDLPFGIDDTFGSISLIGANSSIVDVAHIVAQPRDVTQGRSPNGANTLAYFALPATVGTPGASNVTPSANILALYANLRISEILFRPNNLEFIELTNTSTTTTLTLDGVRIGDGVDYTFGTGVTLAPGAFLVVCKDRTAFQAQFGTGVTLAAGAFTGSLDNSGETLSLRPPQPWDGCILNFKYEGDWFPQLLLNHSLNLVDTTNIPARDYNDKSSWGPSPNPNGTPGVDGPPIINSALTASGILSDPFTYQISASKGPTSFNATPLPGGLNINPATGLITGNPTAVGTFNVTISATNVAGSDTETLVITIASSGPLSTIAWSTIASPQVVNQPFGATLTARDAQGRTVTSYNGTAAITANVGAAPQAKMLITEINTSTVDYAEIQNVGDAAINTTGWFLVASTSSINPNNFNVMTTAMPTSFAAGQAIYISENNADSNPPATHVYYGQTITWANVTQGNSGWCMLVDNTGVVRDFVSWGAYTQANLYSINVTANGFPLTIGSGQWTGAAYAATTLVLSRKGTADNNSSADWESLGSGTTNRGIKNANLTVPFPGGAGTLPITPSNITFSNGVWNNTFTVTATGTNATLRANNGAGIIVDSNAVTIQADSDSDGMGDAWETANGLAVGTNDANADKDGDGQTNLMEWLAGTNPSAASSTLRALDVGVSGDDVTISWNSISGRRYRVYCRDNFDGGSWVELTPTPVTATGTTSTYTHTGGATGQPQRFYRILAWP